ncbi:MAG: Na/Pi cotransporter family protein, partial [Rhodospirillales bacterium]|nr:Na/Pi cotransporter family protein [Rhodospirillales bacterium]
MGAGLTLLDLGGAVALLLWGVHMVQSGISRAYGPDLRRLLSTTLGNRLAAFAAGLGVTAILQSSTATALMMAGFCADRLVGLVPALAVMLGANVGTTLIVQLLSFDVASFAPVLVLIGVLLFRRGGFGAARDLARVSIGLGLMLMALHQLLALVTPYADMPSLRLLLGAIATQKVLDVLLAAVLTALAHSSVAVVLLVASLAARGAVPPEAAFALVLGANLGTALNPLLEGAGSADPEARRLPLGNFLTRLVGTIVALIALDPIAARLVVWVPDAARAVADFHTGFNLILALVFLPLLGPFGALLRRLLPAPVAPNDPARPRYLDAGLRDKPAAALAAAGREALRMADRLEGMLSQAADAIASGNWRRVGEIRREDDILDRLNHAIRDFLATLDTTTMEAADRT